MNIREKIFLLFFLSLSTGCFAQNKYDDKVIELNNRALQLFREDKTDSALILIDKAIEIDSSYNLAYYNKFNCLWQLERNEAALTTAKYLSNISKEKGYMILGLAYEKVGELDSAKGCYKYLLQSAKGYIIDTLDFRTRLGLTTLLTIVEGKEKGFSEIQKLFTLFGNKLNEYELEDLKMYRNEIENYQNGGYLEFSESANYKYCLSFNGEIEELHSYLIDIGINADISSKGNEYYFKTKYKFREKAKALGFSECK